MHKGMLTMMFCAVLLSCSDPEGPEPLPPIKESFEWRLDTIRSPGASQFFVNDVYGTKGGDVYLAAIGNGGWREMFWKYQDSCWSPIELNQKYGGPLRGEVWLIRDLSGVAGSKRVWMAGSRQRDTVKYPINRKLQYGFLAAYDGQNFSEVDLYYEPEITCLDVVTDESIWLGCRGQWIYHYNGTSIQKIRMPMERIEELSQYTIEYMHTRAIASTGDEVVLAVSLYYGSHGGAVVQMKYRNPDIWEIAEYRNDANRYHAGGMTGYWRSPEGDLYSSGDHVYKYQDGKWNELYSTGILTHRIFGSSSRDIWAIGVQNYCARGVEGDWKANEFFRMPDSHKSATWINGWTDGDRVFIVGNPDYDSMDFGIVAHGK